MVLIQSKKVNKKYYRHDKITFDICFVANKYMPGGVDKGFDRFWVPDFTRVTKLKQVIESMVGKSSAGDANNVSLWYQVVRFTFTEIVFSWIFLDDP